MSQVRACPVPPLAQRARSRTILTWPRKAAVQQEFTLTLDPGCLMLSDHHGTVHPDKGFKV